jgi:hypothetical protein
VNEDHGDADGGDRVPQRVTQRVSRWILPVVALGWLLAMAIAYTRGSWYLVGEASVGAAAGLPGPLHAPHRLVAG